MNIWNIFYAKYKFTEIDNHSLEIQIREPFKIAIMIFQIFIIVHFTKIMILPLTKISNFKLILATLILFSTIKTIRDLIQAVKGKILKLQLIEDKIDWEGKTVYKISEIEFIKLVEKINGNDIPNSYQLVFNSKNEDLFKLDETLNKQSVNYVGKRISQITEIELRYSRITDLN